MMLLHEILDKSAQRFPERPALRYRETAFDYATLAYRTARTAGGLRNLGAVRGARVAVQLPNRPELAELFFACSRIGAICVPLHPALKPRQLQHVLRDSGARILVLNS